MHIDCFACLPAAPRGPEPRMLCMDHKCACVLADGALLHTTLALASPPDAPLEGSSLGWLYNPVFVVTAVLARGRRPRKPHRCRSPRVSARSSAFANACFSRGP